MASFARSARSLALLQLAALLVAYARCWWIQATLSSPMIRVRAGSTAFPVRLPVSTAFLALRPPAIVCPVLRAITNKRVAQP
uniref:Uncharacterized protein n=1 Tax=Oryza barthii TaxID=65489 RepID=A0A0D3GI98_9ORYZ